MIDANLVAGILGGAFMGSIVTSLFTLYRDHKNDERKKKGAQILAIAWLQGVKHTVIQSYASYYSAFIASETLQIIAFIRAIRYVDYDNLPTDQEDAQQYVNQTNDDALNNSLDLKEFLREKQRSEELQIEIAKHEERFWRTIGKIRILFPNDRVDDLIGTIKDTEEELNNLELIFYKRANNLRRVIETKPGFLKSNIERNEWTRKMEKAANNWNMRQHHILKLKLHQFESKIDNLIDYLQDGLDNDCHNCTLFCSKYKCPLKPPPNVGREGTNGSSE